MGGARGQPGPILSADPAATEARIGQLHKYMEKAVLGPGGFCCPHFDECRESIRPADAFFEGQLSHVGRHYDLWRDGRALRIMVVGQEYGHPPGRVSLEARYRMIHDESGLSRSYYRTGTVPSRNPHMRGTTSALRVLLGKGLGADAEGECVSLSGGRVVHVFDAFALVNVLLCSAVAPGTKIGRSTPIMRSNCMTHFQETLRILEPTVIVLQGLSVAEWTAQCFTRRRAITPFLQEAQSEAGRALVCSFSHPSARGNLRWGDRLDAPYLTTVVEPALRRALTLL